MKVWIDIVVAGSLVVLCFVLVSGLVLAHVFLEGEREGMLDSYDINL